MDIAPLYELRGRLRTAMISGSDLIGEDFRLKRAAEAMKPLGAASPVFAKINQLLGVLLSDSCKDRAAVLLDTITLVDAVLCTQAAVDVPGELTEIETFSCGKAVTDVPYSALSSLLDALTYPGSGKYGFVVDTYKNYPELFEDYRVKVAMVNALGASYAQLADQAAVWLTESGEQIVPLLKRDFDPKGRREMVRRVQVMDAVAGGKLNDFYLEHLSEAEKDVRGALIYALRHSDKNTEYLISLTKTEKGNLKKMAYWALVSMENQDAQEFFRSLMRKKPVDGLNYLGGSTTAWASDLVAEGLKALLETWCGAESVDYRTEEAKEAITILMEYFRAMEGKSGDAVCECYRIAAQAVERLEKFKVTWYPVVHQKGPARQAYEQREFTEILPELLLESLKITCDRGLADTAEELYEKYGGDYFHAACVAKQLFAEAAECYQWLETQVVRKTLFGTKFVKETGLKLHVSFRDIFWDDSRKCYCRRFWAYHAAEDRNREIVYPVNQPFDGPISDLFMACKGRNLDEVLFQWIRPDNPAYLEKLGEHFRQRALTIADNAPYLEPMRKCGVRDCSGLAVRYCKGREEVYGWDMRNYLRQMPGTRASKLREAEAVYELVKRKEIKGLNLKERLEEFMDELNVAATGSEE